MTSIKKRIRKINGAITAKIIDLQRLGYHYDFKDLGCGGLSCIQTNLDYPLPALRLSIVAKADDHLSGTSLYLHAVETDTGDMGVFMAGYVHLACEDLRTGSTKYAKEIVRLS